MINGHILRVNKYKGFGNMIQMPRFLDQYPVRLLQDPALNRTDHFKMRDKNNIITLTKLFFTPYRWKSEIKWFHYKNNNKKSQFYFPRKLLKKDFRKKVAPSCAKSSFKMQRIPSSFWSRYTQHSGLIIVCLVLQAATRFINYIKMSPKMYLLPPIFKILFLLYHAT